MTNIPELYPTKCSICKTLGNATELYPATLNFDAFNAAKFSARRLPDRVHYRIVQCSTCGLIRSDPVAGFAAISELYSQSTFEYGSELTGLNRTYGRYLRLLESYGVYKGSLLEIGCGNGFFLEEALSQGYESIAGVEPSQHAIAQSAPHIRSHLVCDLMHSGLFSPASFDVVCLFQVFDHLPDPGTLLEEVCTILRPGGMVLFLNHNLEALSNRLMGERSPIIDIEHTYLYSPTTMHKIIEQHGFALRHIGGAVNTYSLHYLMWLVPLPSAIKQPLLKLLKNSLIGSLQLSLPLGNLVAIAQKVSSQ